MLLFAASFLGVQFRTSQEPSLGSRRHQHQAHRPRLVWRLRREVLGGQARAIARRLRPGRGREPSRRARHAGRRGGLSTRRRAGHHLHARLLPPDRRRAGRLRRHRGDERPQRRLRDGRLPVPRPLDRRVPRGAPDGHARGDLHRGGRDGSVSGRAARRRAHDSGRGAEVRAGGDRQRPSRRDLEEGLRAAW